MFIAIALLLLLSLHGQALGIGVNYGRVGNDLPTPAQAVELLVRSGISRVKLYDSDPVVVSAFANTGIELGVTAFNEAIWELSLSPERAGAWFASNILPHLPATNITTILLGNELLTRSDPALAAHLVPALRNLHKSLVDNRLESRIKLTTSHAMDVLDFSKSYPPSAGAFSTDPEVMKPLLEFLADTGAPFVIDAYPYFAYRDDRGKHVELAYALLDRSRSRGVKDWVSGLHYSTLLEAQVDTIYSAMEKLGFGEGRVRVVVGETGWPSLGEEKNFGAGMENARAFVNNLVAMERLGGGTPLRAGIPMEAYLFALFNENLKPGSTAERNFGIFHPNMTLVYQVDFQ